MNNLQLNGYGTFSDSLPVHTAPTDTKREINKLLSSFSYPRFAHRVLETVQSLFGQLTKGEWHRSCKMHHRLTDSARKAEGLPVR